MLGKKKLLQADNMVSHKRRIINWKTFRSIIIEDRETSRAESGKYAGFQKIEIKEQFFKVKFMKFMCKLNRAIKTTSYYFQSIFNIRFHQFSCTWTPHTYILLLTPYLFELYVIILRFSWSFGLLLFNILHKGCLFW